MTLESRASRAAASLRSSVAGAGSGFGFPTLLRRRRLAAIGGMAALTVLMAAAMALATVLPVFDDDQDAAQSTVATTTMPTEPTTPAVVADPHEDEETTTTTTPAATTTTVGGSEAAPAGLTTTTEPETTTTTKPATSTTTTKPVTKSFTAWQQSGGSGDGLTDVFSGTGPAGYTVRIWSPAYGHILKTTVIPAGGNWSITVNYGDVAANQAFDVKADLYNGGTKIDRKYFTYTWINGAVKPYGANQQSGGSGAALTDVFWGTGPAGYTVKVYVPDYGRIVGQAIIDANGDWSAAVDYGAVAANTNFHVKVDFYNGGTHTKRLYFSYTWIDGDVKEFTASLASGGTGDGLDDVASGTGPAGHTVKIWLPTYGRTLAQVPIDANGNWSAAINYGDVAANQQFEVKADLYNGGSFIERIIRSYTWINGDVTEFTASLASGGTGDGLDDVASGTGPAGHTVKIWLPTYGRTLAQVPIDANGNWSAAINYGDVAANQQFEVKADLYNGGSFIERIIRSYTWVQEETHSFTANQAFASSSDDPPDSFYYGTGTPGTVVEIISAYGSGSATVGSGGQWEASVTFPSAPVGEPFEVKAKDHTGAKVVFTFEATA